MLGKSVGKVDILGAPQIDRRAALKGLGFGTLELLGLDVLGASSTSVGLTAVNFDNAPFRSVGGYMEDNTLILPSGQSVILAKYGNPLLAPAAFHAAPLSDLDPALVDLETLSKILPSQSSPQEQLQGLRAYTFLIKSGDQYTKIDLSQQMQDPPSIKIGPNAQIEIKVGENRIINFSDGYFVKALYHADKGRIDPNAVIAICEQGQPPTANNPILVSELGSPLLVSSESAASWSRAKNADYSPIIMPPAFLELTGETFIAKGDNMWRYRYVPSSTQGSILEADCKRHGGLPSESWDKMGSQVFYQLVQDGGRIVINPEPHKKNTINLTHLNPSAGQLFGTGLVLSTISNGQIQTKRTSLSAMPDAKISIDGDILILDRDSQVSHYRIVELRRKDGFASDTVDVYAVNINLKSQSQLPSSPLLTEIGSFDFLKAYRDTREIIDNS